MRPRTFAKTRARRDCGASWTKVVTGEKDARAAGLTVTPEGHIVIGTSSQGDGTSMILQGLHP